MFGFTIIYKIMSYHTHIPSNHSSSQQIQSSLKRNKHHVKQQSFFLLLLRLLSIIIIKSRLSWKNIRKQSVQSSGPPNLLAAIRANIINTLATLRFCSMLKDNKGDQNKRQKNKIAKTP